MNVSPDLRRVAHAEARTIIEELTGVIAVVIATVDGFDIASETTRGVEAARIAAMASSISAIGEVVATEAALGRNNSVTISSEKGFAFVQTVYRQDVALVINVIADASAVLAQIAYRTGQCAGALQRA